MYLYTKFSLSPHNRGTDLFSSNGLQKPDCYCMCSLVCVFFLPLLWRALKHFTGEHWKSEKRNPSAPPSWPPLPQRKCRPCSLSNDQRMSWFLSRAMSCSRALEPHPIPLAQLSDVHVHIPTQSSQKPKLLLFLSSPNIAKERENGRLS